MYFICNEHEEKRELTTMAVTTITSSSSIPSEPRRPTNENTS
jgi:hypothetical protein